jgi:hypothetical protein
MLGCRVGIYSTHLINTNGLIFYLNYRDVISADGTEITSWPNRANASLPALAYKTGAIGYPTYTSQSVLLGNSSASAILGNYFNFGPVNIGSTGMTIIMVVKKNVNKNERLFDYGIALNNKNFQAMTYAGFDYYNVLYQSGIVVNVGSNMQSTTIYNIIAFSITNNTVIYYDQSADNYITASISIDTFGGVNFSPNNTYIGKSYNGASSLCWINIKHLLTYNIALSAAELKLVVDIVKSMLTL